MKRLKKGDIIRCHTSGYMDVSREQFCTKGKYYIIDGVDEWDFVHYDDFEFFITDDRGSEGHSFDAPDLLEGYCKWFELVSRNLLLEKIIKYV